MFEFFIYFYRFGVGYDSILKLNCLDGCFIMVVVVLGGKDVFRWFFCSKVEI